MARSAPSCTRSSLVTDIDYLASRIVAACDGDRSVEPQARAVAQYMLVCRDMSPSECADLLARPGAKRALDKLFDCESDFMGPTPRAFGIDIVVYMTANKFQQSLDVKQYGRRVQIDTCLDRTTPKIKKHILHSDSDCMWIRVHYKGAYDVESCTLTPPPPPPPVLVQEVRTFRRAVDIDKYFATNYCGVTAFTVTALHERGGVPGGDGGGGSVCVQKIPSAPVAPSVVDVITTSGDVLNPTGRKVVGYSVLISSETKTFRVCERVYEVYVMKTSTKSNRNKLNYLLDYYDANKTEYSMIFCSELKHFAANPLLFISNYVKFTYCYTMNRDIFDPKTYDEIKAMTLCLSECALFMSTGNLASMSTDTHGPLVAYTGERPKVLMSKFRRGTNGGDGIVYNNEGTRAMQTVDRGSDLGARSNYVEVVSELAVSDSCLDRVI